MVFVFREKAMSDEEAPHIVRKYCRECIGLSYKEARLEQLLHDAEVRIAALEDQNAALKKKNAALENNNKQMSRVINTVETISTVTISSGASYPKCAYTCSLDTRNVPMSLECLKDFDTFWFSTPTDTFNAWKHIFAGSGKDNVEEADRSDQGFYIRNGIVVVQKNATIPDGTVI